MKNIRIRFNDKGTHYSTETEILDSFKLFGYTYCVHIKHYTVKSPDDSLFEVSELTSGANCSKLGSCFTTIDEAKEVIRHRLSKLGETVVKEKTESMIEKIKKLEFINL